MSDIPHILIEAEEFRKAMKARYGQEMLLRCHSADKMVTERVMADRAYLAALKKLDDEEAKIEKEVGNIDALSLDEKRAVLGQRAEKNDIIIKARKTMTEIETNIKEAVKEELKVFEVLMRVYEEDYRTPIKGVDYYFIHAPETSWEKSVYIDLCHEYDVPHKELY